MQFNTFVSTIEDLEACADAERVTEVLIEPQRLARLGWIDRADAAKLAGEAHRLGLRAVLVWDILMTPEEFTAAADELEQIGPENFDAVRVQCPGAARYLMQQFPACPIHFLAETGGCNLEALKSLTAIFGKQLERMILSAQLPAKRIAHYVRALQADCEILGCGRIMLFHSRRNLLRSTFGAGADRIEAIAAAEDLHDRPLPVLANGHGTFLFLDRDQYVLHRTQELAEGMPEFFRLDLRHLSRLPASASAIRDVAAAALNEPEALRSRWPRDTCAPFFRSNQTTKQFRFL